MALSRPSPVSFRQVTSSTAKFVSGVPCPVPHRRAGLLCAGGHISDLGGPGDAHCTDEESETVHWGGEQISPPSKSGSERGGQAWDRDSEQLGRLGGQQQKDRHSGSLLTR